MSRRHVLRVDEDNHVGVVLGIALSLAGGRLISAMLFGVSPSDPTSLLFASEALVLMALAAAVTR